MFSTFAAMGTGSGSLAVGELIGAAGFITAVVAGSMALVRPFKVARRSFVRDVTFFIVAASFSMIFVADGSLQLWECATMVAFYCFYVFVVVAWHWYLEKKKRRNEREARARAHFLVTESGEAEDVEELDEDLRVGGSDGSATRGDAPNDFTILERTSMEEDDDARDRYMAEISRNMRIRRQLSSHRSITGNPIRPSLVGALEFRAVLSSLEKSRNQPTASIYLRRYSDDPAFTLAQQHRLASRSRSNPNVDQILKDTNALKSNSAWPSYKDDDHQTRNRAVSVNDASTLRRDLQVSNFGLHNPTASSSTRHDGPSLLIPTSNKANIDFLKPYSDDDYVASPNGYTEGIQEGLPASSRSPSIHLALPNANEIPIVSSSNPIRQESYESSSRLHDSLLLSLGQQSTVASQLSSPRVLGSNAVLSFPPYHDNPSAVSTPSRTSSIRLPPPSLDADSGLAHFNNGVARSKLVHWWPYRLLPPPKTLVTTLFPTICSWKEKTIGERILGVLAAPSVFLLTITLPVVDSERGDSNNPSALPDTRPLPLGGHESLPQSSNRPTRRSDEQDRTVNQDQGAPECDGDFTEGNTTDLIPTEETHIRKPGQLPRPEIVLPQNENPYHHETSNDASPVDPGPAFKEWNRWLVCIQAFTAPHFVVFIVWANTDSQLSLRDLLNSFAYTMIGSLLALSLLLTTTTEARAPRYRPVLCFLGFIVSVAWISTIANEVVGVLKALGVILGMSDAILGLTIFAVGNRYGPIHML